MLFELTMFSTYYNQQIINRWTYLSQGVAASVLDSFALMKAFGAIPDNGIYPANAPFYNILVTLSSQFKVSSMIARAASNYSPSDFYERPFVTPYSGSDGGEPMSPVLAYGYRTNRVRTDIDRATKRFAGVVESGVAAGGVIEAGKLGFLEIAAAKMSEILTYDDEGNTVTFSPCVVSKEEYVTPRGHRAYRYYPTLSEQLEHTATGVQWQPYATVRTQGSRQYGRGV